MGPKDASQPQRTWVIGSAPDCEIIVNADAVSAHHCRVRSYPHGYALDDVGSTNGTYVDGGRIPPGTSVWITPQQRVTLGMQTPFPWRELLNAPAPRPETQVQAGVWKRQMTIGRAPESSQVLDYPMVSWNHAVLLEDEAGQWFVVDLGSSNGTAIGTPEAKVKPRVPAAVRPNDDLFLGSLKIPMQRLLGNQRLTLGGATGSSVSMRSDRMEIGRDPQCDYPLDYPMISWRHAVLTREGNAYFVTDLNSRNGTYVNGLRVAPRVKTMLQPGSEIGLGSFRFRLLFSGQFERREYTGNVAIELVSLTVDIQQKGKPHRLLHPVSLTVFPSELISVMGPAGAGKTTLLKAMNGYTVPSNGRVLFNGADLYQFYDRFRLQMGYVPQDDIMHALLTVDEALFYTAKLRTDLRTHEIRQRTLQVLTDLGIDDIGDRQIGSPEMKVISGGQRKRVNIAMELLSDPNVLFLDEPTSGLSSYDALQVIRLLRRLATSGKTVILTIHQPSLDIYKEFDNLIMVSRDKGQGTSGALSYYGPAYPDSIQFFNPNRGGEELSPEMLLDGLAKQPTSLWVDTYDRSSYKKQFVIDRTGQMPQQSGSGNT